MQNIEVNIHSATSIDSVSRATSFCKVNRFAYIVVPLTSYPDRCGGVRHPTGQV